MMLSFDKAWLAIAGMALITYFTRAMPFLFRKVKAKLSEPDKYSSMAAALGPSLLAAITVVTILPGLQNAINTGSTPLLSYLVGIVITIFVLRIFHNAGLAVMSGVGIYFILSFIG
ncbi:AzlD domain-containing protein [Sodalis sp. RH14]|uniref:AzlD domain-containing protein n=1 Tax=Sodalis sp. RH14 TaxID=3394329 RepID=UPI0039B59ED0